MNGGDRQLERRLRLLEGFVYLADTPLQHVDFQLGRQYFEEQRDWLYGERLDGVRMYADQEPFHLEVSATTGREYLDEDNRTQDIWNFISLV